MTIKHAREGEHSGDDKAADNNKHKIYTLTDQQLVFALTNYFLTLCASLCQNSIVKKHHLP